MGSAILRFSFNIGRRAPRDGGDIFHYNTARRRAKMGGFLGLWRWGYNGGFRAREAKRPLFHAALTNLGGKPKMKEIQSLAMSIQDLLGKRKFAIDFYQREYDWKESHIVKLLKDLSGKFWESHKEENVFQAIQNYGRYFLGSIIISENDGKNFIIDGQQRITSLTLLLIFIHRQINDSSPQKRQIAELITSYKRGRHSFNLDGGEERNALMQNLLFGEQPPIETDAANIITQYENIEENFPDELRGTTLPFFADWLIENVYIVAITAHSDSDAYTIFETMNDRGLSLTSADMLKSYLLANIPDVVKRKNALNLWRGQIDKLRKIGKAEDANAIKSWLRSQHAMTIRKRNESASPQDFDLIGTEFHRWVKDKKEALRLSNGDAFCDFIDRNFAFYSEWHLRIQQAAAGQKIPQNLGRAIYHNAQNKFTLQYLVLLAPLRLDDAENEITRKLRIVARHIDILIARRVWNGSSTTYSVMHHAMFQLAMQIRHKPIDELRDILVKRLKDEKTFADNLRFGLNGQNGPWIRRLLARMTDFVEIGSGMASESRYDEYVPQKGKNRYEIEHIWADKHERHADEFPNRDDFSEYRDRIGGLLLLPKSFNASYGSMPYADKIEHYLKNNMLAQSLHKMAYEHNPGFMRFKNEHGLEFQPHAEFKKSDLDTRQNLYTKLAEKIWDPSSLMEI